VQIVILNGANTTRGWDAWPQPRPDRTVISAAQLTGRKLRRQSPLWYDWHKPAEKPTPKRLPKPTAHTRPITPRGSSQRSRRSIAFRSVLRN
jgi:hypothetical protein